MERSCQFAIFYLLSSILFGSSPPLPFLPPIVHPEPIRRVAADGGLERAVHVAGHVLRRTGLAVGVAPNLVAHPDPPAARCRAEFQLAGWVSVGCVNSESWVITMSLVAYSCQRAGKSANDNIEKSGC